VLIPPLDNEKAPAVWPGLCFSSYISVADEEKLIGRRICLIPFWLWFFGLDMF
jgi:hypothetical protein